MKTQVLNSKVKIQMVVVNGEKRVEVVIDGREFRVWFLSGAVQTIQSECRWHMVSCPTEKAISAAWRNVTGLAR